MRCPQCSQWNRASLPRCIRCGTELSSTGPVTPSWRAELKDDRQSKEYIRVDEAGDIDVAPDEREVLAAEMTELKERKDDGEKRQRQLRQEAAERGSAPSSVNVRSRVSAMESFFDVQDIPPANVQQEEAAPAEEPEQEAPIVPRNPRGTRVIAAPAQWQDSRTYDPIVDDMNRQNMFQQPPTLSELPRTPSRRSRQRRVINILTTVIIVVLLVIIGVLLWAIATDDDIDIPILSGLFGSDGDKQEPIITATIMNDLAAHTILIPGEDGQSIYIQELHQYFDVIAGFATIEVPDYRWYEDQENISDSSMQVTLTPYVRTTSGRQQQMDQIRYTITIPLSPIQLVTPESLRTEVTTAMYSMQFNVRPGSKVFINDKDVSDTVNESGVLTYNATVQPIGDNNYTVRVRSPYCRENSMQVILYREVQEIPLDLSATTYTSTSLSALPITAITLPGAEIEVLTPHSDLNITDLDTTGEFTFIALFEKIGYNTISITASFPGKKTSQVDYTIYYLPNPDVYTPKAWPLNNASDYAELVGNINYRAARSQVYLAVGSISEIISEKPQMAVVYTSADGKNQPVLLENQTKVTWKVGDHYRFYADVYGIYDGMPWLVARYCYE